ncbi:hypothetical protein HMPREF1987_01901 [Peptostreptococcaceae bacterium oral taxon 113 str. W5053]|nr:hypothetical protein HMPREF1987_01901 [Peptostreptococcaceae bacterium oral taxon 113 str. W5053]
MNIVIITGLSGAGKSSALRIFEDMGYYSMDNLPPSLIMNFVDLTESSSKTIEHLAVVVDLRGGDFFRDLSGTIQTLKQKGHRVTLLFLDAEDEVLIRRYKELRRPHPMALHGDLVSGIEKERGILSTVRGMTDLLLETSKLSTARLKGHIEGYFRGKEQQNVMFVSVNSFGFKYGLLEDGDLIFDVRFLPNPFYVAELKEHTGLEPNVRNYVMGFNEAEIFMEKLTELLRFLIPQYLKEGKNTLVIGIGCTGGKHRSVVIAEALKEALTGMGHKTVVYHRDEKLW